MNRGAVAISTPTYEVAMAALQKGISVLPIKFDGTKKPAVSRWGEYQMALPTRAEISQWFADPRYGLAVVTGEISGNLEALDFDDDGVFRCWLTRVRRNSSLNALYERIATGYEEVSPAGGRHLLYYCDEIGASQKLAMRATDDPDKPKTLAETRGSKALLIIDPSMGTVHRSGKPYRRVRGSVNRIERITSDQRLSLFASVRALNELPDQTPSSAPYSPPAQRTTRRENGVVLPGHIYNQRASWIDVLEPHGWRYLDTDSSGIISYWTKGKGNDVHATTNFQGNDRLKVFSTSTVFDTNTSYDKFGAYAILNHGGDTSAASRDLYRLGYCMKVEEK